MTPNDLFDYMGAFGAGLLVIGLCVGAGLLVIGQCAALVKEWLS